MPCRSSVPFSLSVVCSLQFSLPLAFTSLSISLPASLTTSLRRLLGHLLHLQTSITCSSCCNLRGAHYHKKNIFDNKQFSCRRSGRSRRDDEVSKDDGERVVSDDARDAGSSRASKILNGRSSVRSAASVHMRSERWKRRPSRCALRPTRSSATGGSRRCRQRR